MFGLSSEHMRMQVYISPIATSSEWAELDPLKVMGAICAIGDSIRLLSCKLGNRKISK